MLVPGHMCACIGFISGANEKENNNSLDQNKTAELNLKYPFRKY